MQFNYFWQIYSYYNVLLGNNLNINSGRGSGGKLLMWFDKSVAMVVEVEAMVQNMRGTVVDRVTERVGGVEAGFVLAMTDVRIVVSVALRS